MGNGSGGADASVLFNLSEFKVVAQTMHNGEWWLLIETSQTRGGCPSCGVIGVGNGRRRVLVRDLPIAGTPVVLVWAKRTRRCLEPLCERGSWSETSASLTERARREICRCVGADLDTVAEAAREFGVGWFCAHQAVVDYGDALIAADRRLERVEGARSRTTAPLRSALECHRPFVKHVLCAGRHHHNRVRVHLRVTVDQLALACLQHTELRLTLRRHPPPTAGLHLIVRRGPRHLGRQSSCRSRRCDRLEHDRHELRPAGCSEERAHPVAGNCTRRPSQLERAMDSAGYRHERRLGRDLRRPLLTRLRQRQPFGQRRHQRDRGERITQLPEKSREPEWSLHAWSPAVSSGTMRYGTQIWWASTTLPSRIVNRNGNSTYW